MKERDKRFEEEEEEKGSGGGGGNKNALPYGLLQGAGYNTQGLSPSEAWALCEKLNLLWKRTDEDKQAIKEKNEKFESEGGLSDELYKKAKEVINVISFNKTGNKAEIKSAIDAISEVSKQYKLDKLAKVSTATLGLNVYAQANGAEIQISHRLMRNPENAYRLSVSGWEKNREMYIKELEAGAIEKRYTKEGLAALKEQVKYSRNNVIYKGEEVRSTVMHELGHVVASQLFGQLNRGAMKKDVNGLVAQKKRELVYNTFQEAKKSGDIYKISYYGAQDEKEFFAECFAIKQMGKEKLPKKIDKMMKEVLK